MKFHPSLSSTLTKLVLITSQHQHGPWKSKDLKIIGKDNKCQITAVLGGTMTGDFLPFQVVYQGITSRCLPSFRFPQDWDITYSANHWSNEETMKMYLQNIIFPYVRGKKEELGLPAEYPSLLLFDNFNGQCTEELLKLIDGNNINTYHSCKLHGSASTLRPECQQGSEKLY